jgi:TP53 regulating kinase-like protein
MLRARKLGLPTPALYSVDPEAGCITMERVAGASLKTLLLEGALAPGGPEAGRLAAAAGAALAALHDGGLIHGDLTTSNMLRREGDGALVIIDYGLSYSSIVPEDKAVDLYVLERAITSAHASSGAGLFDAVLAAYKAKSRGWSATMNRFAEVRMRGRKRAMVG